MDDVLDLPRGVLDRARVSRDARFDGKFFIAVTSTRIYCRPVCPVRSPKQSNVRYYATAAAAAEAGFRPCLRCRPEAAPGTPAWLGTSAVVRRALRLIHEGALDEDSVETLATRVGIGSRHLHRLFLQHVGASPIAVAQTRRLHFAKRLLDETDLPMTEVALAAGFGSLRRFNFAFQHNYKRSPRELRQGRRRGRPVPDGDEVILRLAYRPPYDWSSLRDYLAARAVPGVERVDARGYARTIWLPKGHAIVRVTPSEGESALELHVRGAEPSALFQLSAAARRAFDLAADPERIALALKSDHALASLVKRNPGLRIPGSWDAFECTVRAILGEASNPATKALAHLVERAGTPVNAAEDGLTHLFPSPSALASASLEGLGISEPRIHTLRRLSQAVLDGLLDFGAGTEEVTRALALQGVGAALAQYVAMRALGDPDAFPIADQATQIRAEVCRPWRSYAALHLWHEPAAPRGVRRAVHVRKRPVRAQSRR
jgi:AraC family transcriptional regulator, regulatory protein of adaptative response / DNA-3-methyladenine glycosylase II